MNGNRAVDAAECLTSVHDGLLSSTEKKNDMTT